MEATELRIGNWIQADIPTYGEFPIVGISIYPPLTANLFMDMSYYPKAVSMEQARPILLTEEWILRCGFVKIKREGSYGPIYALSSVDIDFCLEVDFHRQPSYFFGVEYTDSPYPRDENHTHNFAFKIKYVHQLQNLYFSIKGEELKITLDEGTVNNI